MWIWSICVRPHQNRTMIIKWKHFPRYWSFVRGIHRSPVNSPHKGQWRGALMFSLICAWSINGRVNNRETGDLRRHRAHYDVIVMSEREPCAYFMGYTLCYSSLYKPMKTLRKCHMVQHKHGGHKAMWQWLCKYCSGTFHSDLIPARLKCYLILFVAVSYTIVHTTSLIYYGGNSSTRIVHIIGSETIFIYWQIVYQGPVTLYIVCMNL